MQYCPNCGAPCQDDALFCEACGTDLREGTVLQEASKETDRPDQQEVSRQRQSPETENGSKQAGKHMTALIAGTMALVAVIIAGTAFGVHKIRSSGKQEQQTSVSKLADTEGDGPSAGTTDQTEETASGADEKANDAELKPTIVPFEEEPDETSDSAATGTDAADDGSTEQSSTGLKPTIAPLEEEPTDGMGTQSEYETYYVVNCKESITLRKSASTSAGEYCQIPLGASVSFVEQAENGFYKVIYNGTTGYALASYLAPEADGGSEAGSRMVVVNCKESITLRKTPSTRGEEFCQIPLGAEVEYLGTAENGFYTVKYNGFTGYALASYLEWAS